MKRLALTVFSLLFLVAAADPCPAFDEMGEGVYIGRNGQGHSTPPSRSETPTEAEEQALTIPAVDMQEIERNETYRKLMSAKGKKQRRKSLSEEARSLRPKSIEETASRVGFQEGYRYRYRQIEAVLKRRGQMLDSIFNFGPLLLENGRVMPPVIAFADAFAEIRNTNEMVQTGLTYKILEPAKFITVQPSWRDYLLVPEDALQVEKVHPSMLPLDAAEQLIWQDAVSEGWISGMEHADMMFQTGVNRMLVDLRGIIQYQMLARQGYIAMPQVSRGHLAVRVGDENLEFDQQTFRITEKARFQNVERSKKKAVRLDRPAQPERRKAAQPKKVQPKKVQPVKKPANTGAKLTPPKKGEIEVFVETPESHVDVTAKSVSVPISPEDLSETLLRRTEEQNAGKADPANMEPPMVSPAVPERAESPYVPDLSEVPSIETPEAPRLEEPAPAPEPEPEPEPAKPSRHGDFWGTGRNEKPAPEQAAPRDEPAPEQAPRGSAPGPRESGGSVPRNSFWD